MSNFIFSPTLFRSAAAGRGRGVLAVPELFGMPRKREC